MYNIFRIAGDLLHLASFLILLAKIFATRSCKGISLKTQCLYVVVFVTRYLDLFWNFTSLYNSLMKIVFIGLSSAIVYLMLFKHPIDKTYNPTHDNFNVWLLLGPTFVLALLVHEYFSVSEVLWTWSIYLEAVAIVPQLIVIHAHAKDTGGFVDTLNAHYVFALGGYRALYLLNWIWRLFTEPEYSSWIVWVAGMVQTIIYADFFWYYIKARLEGTRMTLPL